MVDSGEEVVDKIIAIKFEVEGVGLAVMYESKVVVKYAVVEAAGEIVT
jgi:hypothetical protein